MRLSRRVQLWLADRHPGFDRPGVYRRSPSVAGRANDWDALLIAMIAVPLIGIGAIGLCAGLFAAACIVAAWL